MTLQTIDGHCDLQDTLAAAACAVRQGTQAFRTDPNSYAKGGLALVSALVTAESRKAIPSSKKYARVFEASLGATSWRNIFDQVDFGPGRPTIILGGVILTQARSCVVTKGPGGDVFCARCASLKAHLDSCKAAEHLSSLHRRPFLCEQQQPERESSCQRPNAVYLQRTSHVRRSPRKRPGRSHAPARSGACCGALRSASDAR